MGFLSGIWDNFVSVHDGTRVSEILIDEGVIDISEESLFQLAEKIETPDPAAFVWSVQEDLQDNEEWQEKPAWKRFLGI